MANPKFPHLSLAKLAKTYGDIMSVRVGVHDVGKSLTKDKSVKVRIIIIRDQAVSTQVKWGKLLRNAHSENLTYSLLTL